MEITRIARVLRAVFQPISHQLVFHARQARPPLQLSISPTQYSHNNCQYILFPHVLDLIEFTVNVVFLFVRILRQSTSIFILQLSRLRTAAWSMTPTAYDGNQDASLYELG